MYHILEIFQYNKKQDKFVEVNISTLIEYNLDLVHWQSLLTFMLTLETKLDIARLCAEM